MNTPPAPDPFWTLFWAAVSALAAVGSLAVVIISIRYVRNQLEAQKEQMKTQTKLAKAANAQALASTASQFSMELIKDYKLTKLWLEGPHHDDDTDYIEREQYGTLLSWWLIFFENVNYHRDKELLDKEIDQSWERVFIGLIRELNIGQHWEFKKPFYSDAFQKYVDGLLIKANASSPNAKIKQATLATSPRRCKAEFINEWGSKISAVKLKHKSGDKEDKAEIAELTPGGKLTLDILYTTGYQSRRDSWWVQFTVASDDRSSLTWSSPNDFYYDLYEEDEDTTVELKVNASRSTLHVKRAKGGRGVKLNRRKTAVS